MMDKQDFLTREELFDAIENDKSGSHWNVAAVFLQSAITDWPTPDLEEPALFITELKEEIKGELTFDNLTTHLKYLHPSRDGWKMEAISDLLEMFDFERKSVFDKKVELETIIQQITDHYRK